MNAPGKAIFLSYASQDGEAAQRICDALRAAGMEVWFDKNELRGGDAWAASIRAQINSCALFVPVISANTQAREEGYFRFEWKLAVDRTHLMAHDRVFLLPVVIDDTMGAFARVPEKFEEIQWTRLATSDALAAFVERTQLLLSAEGGPRSVVAKVTFSLPAERDAFVGRMEQLADLKLRFGRGARLVSLSGTGGTGKTRLAIRFGWNARGDFPGGVWFCDLSAAVSLDGIVHAVAQALDVPFGRDDPISQLSHAVAARGRCLLILDNFEQVASHAEKTLGHWLNHASEATFLVTTREVLGLQGEVAVALAPLASLEAAELFTLRAEAAMPGFTPNTEDRKAIEALARMLDGLPLAIELAASRIRVLAPRSLLKRMTERFRLLTSTGGRPDRQATLRAAFDWSWDLLASPERASLAQLSVFNGGFTLEAAEAVIDLSNLDDAPWVVDVIQSLVQKSLVRQVADFRFDLLMSVQEYASEQLRSPERYPDSGPPALRAAEERHGRYFAGLNASDAAAFGHIELDNLVAACRRAVERADADVTTRALEGVWSLLVLRGPFRVGVELASIARNVEGLAAADRASIQWIAGQALAACGRFDEACGQYEQSLTLPDGLRDRRFECRTLASLGFCETQVGRLDLARAHLAAALTEASDHGELELQVEAHNGLGTLGFMLGGFEEARTHYAAAIELARRAKNRNQEGRVLGNLGILHAHSGAVQEARSCYEAALAATRATGSRWLEGNTLCNLGLLHQVQGRFDDALDALEGALTVAREIGNARLECIVSCNLGIVAESLGRSGEAGDRYESAVAFARELGDSVTEGQSLGYLGALHARQGDFATARDCLDRGEALLRSASDRRSLGILLCCRAETEHLAKDGDAARNAFSAAEAIAAEVLSSPDSELGTTLLRVRGLLDLPAP